MDGANSVILKVKKKLDSDSIDDTKIIKYLDALDKITIGFDLLKSTGIGKTVNNLKKKGGTIADLSKSLIRKWKDLVPTNDSQKNNKSPLNSLKSDFKPELLLPPSLQYNVNSRKSHVDEKSVNCSDTMENRDTNKCKVPSMKLCDLSFVSEAPVAKKIKKFKPKSRSTLTQNPSVMSSQRLPSSSLPSSSLPSSSLLSSSLLSVEQLGASLLPDIKPDYIPQRLPDFPPQRLPDYPDDASPKKRKVTTSVDITAELLSSRKSKTQVFSGKRSANRSGVVLSLYEMCIRILTENVEALCDTGGVPYDILQPVLAKCSPAQLWNLEDYNPYFIEDTGPLWKNHCHKDFKETAPENHDDWRALYIKKHEEREKRLKSINAKINASQAARTPVRQVKLAFIQTQAKAPPSVRRKQIRHGTGNGIVVPPPPRIKSSPSVPSSSRFTGISPRKPKTTPMMKKVKQMGSLHRSRSKSAIIRR